MTTADHIAWCEAMDAAGKHDAMGFPFTTWRVAVQWPDGKAARDQLGRQIFETQADFTARQLQRPVPAGQTMGLF